MELSYLQNYRSYKSHYLILAKSNDIAPSLFMLSYRLVFSYSIRWASPLAVAILDCIVHDAYRINIENIDPSKNISMRKVYD